MENESEFKVEFMQTRTYTLYINAKNSEEAKELAQKQFNNILDPSEESQIGYWELVDVEDLEEKKLKRYYCFWDNGFINPITKTDEEYSSVENERFFTEERGYDKEEIAKILNLEIGETTTIYFGGSTSYSAYKRIS